MWNRLCKHIMYVDMCDITQLKSVFTRFSPPPEMGESVDGGWGRILAALHVPELNQANFLQQALTHGAFLTLYAFTQQRLPLSQSIGDEFTHLQHLTQWTCQAKPWCVCAASGNVILA